MAEIKKPNTPTNAVNDGFPPDQIEGEGPMESKINRKFGQDAPTEIDFKNDLIDEELRNIISNELDVLNEIEKQNNLPKGSFSKLGAILDPISEGLEAGLRAAGLGKIANWWIKAEAANFLAGIMRAGEGGLAQAQLGQSAALMGNKEITSQTEENILNTAGQIFSQQMKLSPGMWFEKKYAQSNLGKGKTPTEQMYSKVVEALNLGGK